MRSVLALASVIDLSLRVLATTTRTLWGWRIDTILSLPLVASDPLVAGAATNHAELAAHRL
jgi:hypothetical protein